MRSFGLFYLLFFYINYGFVYDPSIFANRRFDGEKLYVLPALSVSSFYNSFHQILEILVQARLGFLVGA